MGYTLIQGARLVDGTGRAPVADGAVLVEGERIAFLAANIGRKHTMPRQLALIGREAGRADDMNQRARAGKGFAGAGIEQGQGRLGR